MLNPELAIIVSSSTRLITQLTGVLRRFYAQVEVLDRVEELFSPVNPAGMPAPEPITPVLPSLLVLDYASPLPDPYLLQICRELNGQLILICPEEHNGSAALDYALEGCFDEFIVLPADYAALPYRIQKLKRSLKLPLAESSQQSSIDDEQYQTANLMTLTHVFHCMVLPDRTMRRMGGSEATFKEVVGLTYEQLYAKGGWKALVHPDDMAEREACNQAVLRGEKSVCDYRIVTPDHQYRWIREYSQPIIEGGRVARIDGVIQDVTSLKMAQNTELKQHQTIEAMHHATLMLSSTLDLNAVLDRILISLETVLPYDAADVALIENGQGRIVRHRGYTERGLDDVVSQIQFDLAEYPGLTHMMTTGKPIVIQNVRQSPMWRTVENPELEWMASYIGAPIFLHGRVAGFLNLNSQQPNHYQPEYLFLLEAFASQVSAAITNADLHDIVVHHSSELEGRVRDMVLVYEIGKALTSTLNLYKIYTLFYQDFIKTLFASAELQVFLIDQGDSDGYVCDFAIADGKELNTDEISLTLDEVALLSQAIIDDDHVQFNGVFYQPLITRGDPIGVLKIIPGPDDNPEAIDITLLTIVTSVAATAIDNARLYTTVTEQHREIMALYRATRVLYKTDNV
ncbi:MAG TPA: GAF domain-containing protein, partial [Phototrophicaceae bacterium]|nr:GAF domain-containing protein [Phototrophicaceae bacterium]